MGPKRGARAQTVPKEATRTLRQQLRDLLEKAEWDFESLRRFLDLGPKELEESLSHLAKSLRPEGRSLEILPAVCQGCGYSFRPRPGRPFHAPGRCPSCKSERVSAPSFRILSGEAS